MAAISELEVLEAVVGPVAVDVVDSLMRCERSAQTLGHNESVFGHIALALAHPGERVLCIDPHVLIASHRQAAALPPRVLGPL